MSFLLITIPVTLLLSVALLALVIRAAREGQFEDWEGPAARMIHDDDRNPEVEAFSDESGVGVDHRAD